MAGRRNGGRLVRLLSAAVATSNYPHTQSGGLHVDTKRAQSCEIFDDEFVHMNRRYFAAAKFLDLIVQHLDNPVHEVLRHWCRLELQMALLVRRLDSEGPLAACPQIRVNQDCTSGL